MERGGSLLTLTTALHRLTLQKPCIEWAAADASKSKQRRVIPQKEHRLKKAGEHAFRGSFVTNAMKSRSNN